MMTAAQAIIKSLEQEGVKIVFGYPGATVCPLYDAMIGSQIRHILVRQEQAAGHAASGYARMTGQAGVCIATSGPGAANLVTAIASAYLDSIPVIAITGQVRSDLIGRDVFQEIDITGACEPFVKHSYLVKDAQSLPRVIKEAFYIATTGRPGPVLIDIPIDVQTASLEKFVYPERVDIIGYKPRVKGHAVQIKRALAALEKAQRPVICAGGGVFSAGGQEVLMQFAECADIPVVTTMMGVGVLPHDHPLHLGMLGTHGVARANWGLYNADLLIICGARVGDRAVAKAGQISESTTVVHIDVDPAEIGKNLPTQIPIVGDVKTVLGDMLAKMKPMHHTQWRQDCAEHARQFVCGDIQGFLNPGKFLDTLSARMTAGGVMVADVGQNQIWAANHFAVADGRFLTSGGMGTMGYSLPAAIGAKMACPQRQVVAICGDGSFQMSMAELATVCQHDIDVKIVIMKNMRLGLIREIQDDLYAGRHTAIFLEGSPDFIQLAAAYGVQGAHLRDNADIPAAVDQMLTSRGAYVLECSISPDQPSR